MIRDSDSFTSVLHCSPGREPVTRCVLARGRRSARVVEPGPRGSGRCGTRFRSTGRVWFMLRPRRVPGRPSGVIRRPLSLGGVYDTETELARIPHQIGCGPGGSGRLDGGCGRRPQVSRGRRTPSG
ncbi:hypothetical protein O3P69_008218 [Scylla paramamosain]|uniref:Uncharacterized protein n=1 Tax=Scylla paramamosain TaxID=85552 RepID=A0AAW0T2I8_SCYPA